VNITPSLALSKAKFTVGDVTMKANALKVIFMVPIERRRLLKNMRR